MELTLKCKSTSLPLTALAILAHFASDPGSSEVVIVDLDGQAGDVKECLAILQTESRSGIVVGMSVFASSFADTAREDTRQPLEYVEKTEMVLQLQRLLETTF